MNGNSALLIMLGIATTASASNTPLQEWAAAVSKSVQAHWHRPLNHVPEASSCRVWVRVMPNGDVAELRVADDACVQDRLLSDSIERAVISAEPFPPIPDESLAVHGFYMRFRVEP